VVICIPGFTHNKKTKEYGQMVNPELQDGTSTSSLSVSRLRSYFFAITWCDLRGFFFHFVLKSASILP
jgi:hypothetical protein